MNTHVVRWWLPPEANRFKQYLSNGVKIGTGWRFNTSPPSQCDTQPHPNPHRIAPRIVLVAFNAQWVLMLNDSHKPLQRAISKGCGCKFGAGFCQIQASPVRSNRLSYQEMPGLNAVVLCLPLRREERAQSTVRPPKRVQFGSFSFASSAIRIDDSTHRYGSIAVVGGQFLKRLCNFGVNPRTDLACPPY